MSQTNEPDPAEPSAESTGQPSPGAWASPADPAYGQAPGYGQPPEYGQPTEYGHPPEYGQDAYGQTPAYGQPTGYGQRAYGQPPGYGQPAYGQPAPFGPAAPPGYGIAGGVFTGSGPSPILVNFAGPARQRRVTVLFRYVLVIPHVIVLYALGIAAEVVGVIGWFAALFTGQLPDWAHTFLTGMLRWQTRAYAYLFMLTDVYPPFSLDDDGYPVRLVTRPTTLNRLAVLFRIILVIPAGILAAVAASGLVILSFFVWLIALVTGQVPPALHQAVAAIVRYTARYGGFFYMVTSEYPNGLYGDTAAAAAAPGLTAEPEPVIPAGAELGQHAQAQATDGAWRLPLSSAAKGLVTVCLAVGVLVTVGYVILITTVGKNAANTANNVVALTEVEQANRVLAKSIATFPTVVQACNGQLDCVTALDRKLGASLETFSGAIKSISMSGSASSAAASLISDTNAAARDLNQLGSATSVAQYQSYATNGSLQQDLNNVSADYVTLAKDLGAS